MNKFVFTFIKKNVYLLLILALYIFSLLVVLQFGIPNLAHPFTYHMDEWHQLMAVRALFKYGSSNIVGAANGPVFFFFLSGGFLAPFYLFKIVDPFVIKSSVGQLLMQQRLFEVLRVSTLLWGIGSIVLLWYIAKKFLKIRPLIPTLFFVCNPLWLMLSNYFKYDIALTFFLLVSLYCLFWFLQKPSQRTYYLTAVAIGCTLAIKISVLPLVLSYILAYFFFPVKNRKHISLLIYGVGIICLTFLLVGIPDSFFRFSQYYDFFYYNIITQPQDTANFLLHKPVWIYLYTHVYPLTFGHGLYVLFLLSFMYFTYLFLHKKYRKNKQILLLFITLLLFGLSVFSLKIQAIGNRVLVLLPFMALFIGLFYQRLIDKKKKYVFWIITVLFISAFLVQLGESYAWIQMKLQPHPREQASYWMKTSLPPQTIGLENIPIYQQIPDLALQEFYLLQENPKAKTTFRYIVVDSKSTNLPKTVILTNVDFESQFVKDSPKKKLLLRLHKQGYKEIKRFTPSWELYTFYADTIDVSLFSLVPSMPISFYQK